MLARSGGEYRRSQPPHFLLLGTIKLFQTILTGLAWIGFQLNNFTVVLSCIAAAFCIMRSPITNTRLLQARWNVNSREGSWHQRKSPFGGFGLFCYVASEVFKSPAQAVGKRKRHLIKVTVVALFTNEVGYRHRRMSTNDKPTNC
jgi:hypothetical protein